ncbi:MAG: hypothetical protein AAB522_00525 [Patescibacteria group bacterium]
MRLDERKEGILDFIVRDYVRTACPISSLRVSDKKNLNLSPASIRNIMLELDEDGFLYQPYISAGRAPTEKGYCYFVENLMRQKNISENVKAEFDEIFSKFLGDAIFEELTSLMAERFKLFSGVLAEGRVWKRGFAEVLKEPEFKEQDFLLEFAGFADNVEEQIEKLNGINIGEFSVVSSKFGPNHFVFLAGPKRMDYEKASAIIKFIANQL